MSGYALRFISGKYQGNEYPLKKGEEVVIGRGSDIAITLVEDMISRRHARIIVEDDYIVLEDLGSTNGSFVNGERVRKVRIKEGDRILLGTSIIKLVSSEGDNFPDATPSQAAMKPPGLPAPGLPSPGLSKAVPPPLSIGGGQSRGGANTATMAAPAFNMASLGAPPAPGFSAPKPPGLPSPARPGGFGTPSSDAMSAPPAATSGSMSALSAVPKPALGVPSSPPSLGLGVPSAPPSLSFDSPSPSRGFGGSPALPKPAPIPAAAPVAMPAPAAMPAEESYLPPPNGPAIMEGELREMPLGDLFDIFVNSRRNGVLLVQGELDGHLHFRDGRIAFAALGTPVAVHPSKAAMRIVGWTNGNYALYPPDDQAITEYIDEDPLDLLQKAKRQQDELKRYKAELPAGVKRFSVPTPLGPLLRELRPEQLDIFQLVLSYRSVESVVLASEYSEAETYQHLAQLLHAQYIQAA